MVRATPGIIAYPLFMAILLAFWSAISVYAAGASVAASWVVIGPDGTSYSVSECVVSTPPSGPCERAKRSKAKVGGEAGYRIFFLARPRDCRRSVKKTRPKLLRER